MTPILSLSAGGNGGVTIKNNHTQSPLCYALCYACLPFCFILSRLYFNPVFICLYPPNPVAINVLPTSDL